MRGKQYTKDLGSRIIKPSRPRLNRRHFLLGMAAVSITAMIPTVISCSAVPVHDIHNQLTDADFAILIHVQDHLFPSGKDIPGAKDFHAAQYYSWVLMDTEQDPEITQRLRDGMKWTERESQALYKEHFVDLDHSEKEAVLRVVAKDIYGESWLSLVLTYIFEALLGDPIYGANIDKMGWEWLDHRPGIPRPTEANKYKS